MSRNSERRDWIILFVMAALAVAVSASVGLIFS